MLDFSESRLPPFQHQREDVERLISSPFLFIASEMRTGKSKIVVDASQFLFRKGLIDRVIIIAPAPVRDVWFDRQLGEFAKHLWLKTPATITEFHARPRQWKHGPTTDPAMRRLLVYVTNYEFIRAASRMAQLRVYCGPKTLLVLDESSFVKSHSAKQTKACAILRKACGRVVLLNGTPIFHSPLDLFSQGNLLHPKILQCPYVTHFRSKYAVMKPVRGAGGRVLMSKKTGKAIEVVDSWTNLDDLQTRFAPYTVRRLQRECLDLPPKLDAVTLTTPLDPATWRAYKQMREDMVVWLRGGVAVSATAAAKALRLSQITSGYLGGVENEEGEPGSPLEIGREKLDALLWFLEQRFEQEPRPKVVVWCRFRAEMFRVLKEVTAKFPQFQAGAIYGDQDREERHEALRLLKPETSPDAPVFVVGIEGTGSFGLDMTASHTCVTLSSGYSPGRTAQTLDRVYGPGQTEPVAYYEIMATGPAGQWTIDHAIAKARRDGENIATWTAAAWVKALLREE